MISLQTASDLINIATKEDAKPMGILIALTLVFGSVIMYLFKINQDILKKSSEERENLYKEFTAERDRLYKEHLLEIRSFNEVLVKINNQYSDAIRNLVELNKK